MSSKLKHYNVSIILPAPIETMIKESIATPTNILAFWQIAILYRMIKLLKNLDLFILSTSKNKRKHELHFVQVLFYKKILEIEKYENC